MIKKTFPNSEDKILVNQVYNSWLNRLFLEGMVFFSITFTADDFFVGSLKVQIRSLLNRMSFIDFIDFTYGSLDVKKEGHVQINCVLGFRVHASCISYVESKINEVLFFQQLKFKFKHLENSVDVLSALRYVSKDFGILREYEGSFFGLYSPLLQPLHTDTFLEIMFNSTFDSFKGLMDVYSHESITRYAMYAECFGISLGSYSNVKAVPNSVLKNERSVLVYYLLTYYQTSNINLNSFLCIPNLSDFIAGSFPSILIAIKKDIFPFINILELSIIFAEHSNQITSQVIFLLKLYKQYKH